MKSRINDQDIDQLKGKFVILIDPKDKEYPLDVKSKLEFWVEKRIFIIAYAYTKEKPNYRIVLTRIGGDASTVDTQEAFIERWNGWEEDETKRHFRLLTKYEMKLLTAYLINQQ